MADPAQDAADPNEWEKLTVAPAPAPAPASPLPTNIFGMEVAPGTEGLTPSTIPSSTSNLPPWALATGRAATETVGGWFKGIPVLAPQLKPSAVPSMDPDEWEHLTVAGPKASESDAYRIGQAIQKKGEEIFPVTEEMRKEHPWQTGIGTAIGGTLPYAPLLVAAPESLLGTAFRVGLGAAGMGLSGAADTYDDAVSKGATEDQAKKAAGMSAAVNVAIGSLRLDSVLAPIRQTIPGLRGWATAKLAQAGQNGLTFATTGAAQQYLQTEIEKAYYNPNAKWEPGLKELTEQALAGGFLGAFGSVRPRVGERAPVAKEGEIIPPDREGAQPGAARLAAPGQTIEGEAVRPGVAQEAQRLLPGPEAAQAVADIRAAEATDPLQRTVEVPRQPVLEARRALPAPEAGEVPPAVETAPAGLATPPVAIPPKAVEMASRLHPDLEATPREAAEVLSLVDNKATPQEIEAHPLIQRAYQMSNSLPSTNEMEGYGTPEWKANRIGQDANGNQLVGYDGIQDYLTKQATNFSTAGPVRQERRATIVIGPGGAGKSTLMEPLARNRYAAIIDADEAKKVLPEYQGGIGATAVHEESTDLMYGDGGPLQRLMGTGGNVVIQKIGHNPQSIRKLRDDLTKKNYQVDLINLAVDPQEAFRRRTYRFLDTGRINGKGYHGSLAENGDAASRSYHILKAEGGFDDTLNVDANGPRGQIKPIIDGHGTAIARDSGVEPIEQPGSRRGVGQVYGPDVQGVRGRAAPSVPGGIRGVAEGTRGGGPKVLRGGLAKQARAPSFEVDAPTRDLLAREGIPYDLEQIPPIDIKADPARFQYRALTGEGADVKSGHTGRKMREGWQQIAPMMVWRDNSGQDWILDGHHRLVLAKNLANTTNPDLRINGLVLHEADMSAQEAKAFGQRRNEAREAWKAEQKAAKETPKPAGKEPGPALIRRITRTLEIAKSGFFDRERAGVTNLPPHDVTTADGNRVNVRPRVVEDYFPITSDYRSYDLGLGAPSEAKVRGIADTLTPEMLGHSADADRGAPIIGSDGKVESGNARVLALRQMYHENGPQAEAYREWLRQQGVDVPGFQRPILVRQRETPLTKEQRQDFAAAANEPSPIFRATSPEDKTPVSYRPEERDAGHLLSTANELAGEWQRKLGPDIRVTVGGSLTSRSHVRSGRPPDMDVRFLTDNPERDYPKVEAATGLKLRKTIAMSNYPKGMSKGYLIEGPVTRNGVTFDVEAAVRTPAYAGWGPLYPRLFTPDELAAFRADKARLADNKPEYKALKARMLKEAERRANALGGIDQVRGVPDLPGRTSTFVSPSVEQRPAWEAAVGPPTKRQQLFAEASRDADRRLGRDAVQSPVIGAWTDGAEPSIMTVSPSESWDQAVLAAAMKGHLGNQKAVAVFQQNNPVMNAALYSFPARGDLHDIHKNLLADGVKNHTLEPTADGAIVHVLDRDLNLQDAVDKAAARYGTEQKIQPQYGRGEFIGTDISGGDAEERAAGRRAYEKIIAESPVSAAAEHWQDLHNRWAEPLARTEAERLDRGPFLGAETRGYTGEGGGPEMAERGPRRESGFGVVRDVAQNLTANDILDPKTPAIKGPAIKGHNLTVNIARYLEQRGSNALRALGVASGKIEGPDPHTDAILADALTSEAKAALVRDKKVGTDWYTTKTQEAMNVASLMHPEINTDPNARMAYTLALSIASQGEKIPSNARLGENAYDHFSRTGEFPENIPTKVPSIKANFKKANELIKAWGPDKFREFLHTEFTVRGLDEHFKDFGLKIDGENKNTRVYGSAIFGPKVGQGFYQNLSGNFNPVTFDLWWMRTWGRLTGNLVGSNPEVLADQRQRFVDALKAEGRPIPRTQEKLKALAEQIEATHEKDYAANRALYDSKERVKSKVTKAAIRYIFGFDGLKEEPTSGNNRNWMRNVVANARQSLADDGIHVTNADMQAILWYPEKNLYWKLGGPSVEFTNQDYSEALQKIAKQKGFTDEQVLQSLGRTTGRSAGYTGAANERRAERAAKVVPASETVERAEVPEAVPAARTQAGGLPGRGELSGGAGQLAAPGAADLAHGEPLKGLPRQVTIPGQGKIAVGPSLAIRAVADGYMRDAGLPYNPPQTYQKVDPERAARIAKAYENMPHAPNNPTVRAAYAAMAKETMAQWQAIKRTGLKVDFIPRDAPDPYDASPRLSTEDITKNNHMWVFNTDDGFGTTGITAKDLRNNPMLAQSGETIGGRPARINDIFRIVHDYFGHAKEGVGFRADGEENAWRSHSAMYSPLARKAMTSETRGQNSWLNYGPYGGTNRTAKTADTRFADQKIGLLPDWVVNEGAGDKGIEAAQRPRLTTQEKRDQQLAVQRARAAKVREQQTRGQKDVTPATAVQQPNDVADATQQTPKEALRSNVQKIIGDLLKTKPSDVAKWVASHGAMGVMWHLGMMWEPDISAQVDHIINTLSDRARISKTVAGDLINNFLKDNPKKLDDLRAEASRVPAGWEYAEGNAPPVGRKIRLGPTIDGYVNPEYTAHEREIADAVTAIGQKMAPGANIQAVGALRQRGSPIWGAFVNNEAFPKLIAWSLEQGGGFEKTIRHEVVHYLRDTNLIKPEEWQALSKAAVDKDWLSKHDIDDRYPGLSRDHQIEEAVANEFGAWRANRTKLPPGLMRNAFLRMDLFMRRVAAATRKAFGRQATANDIFTRIETGEIGGREKRARGGRVGGRDNGRRDRSAFLYMEPHPSIPDFAQCKTCERFIPKTERCYWFGRNDKVEATDTCGLYVQGPPMKGTPRPIAKVTPKEAGFFKGDVRCENCAAFTKQATCGLYEQLNRDEPELWNLDTKVKPKGCCNGFSPKAKHRQQGGGVDADDVDQRDNPEDMFTPDENMERNRDWAKPGPYTTTLSAPDENDFQEWARSRGLRMDEYNRDKPDYDMRGFWKGMKAGDPLAVSAIDPNDQRMHYPDVWKTPYDATFSDQSQWGIPGMTPHWNGDQYTHPSGHVIYDDVKGRWYGLPKEKRARGGRVIPQPKIDTSHDVRWISEMARDGSTFYRDRSLPKQIINNKKWLKIDEPLKEHEVAEYKAIRRMTDEFKKKHGRGPDDKEREHIYEDAHYNHGELAEHDWLRSHGYDVGQWEAWCRGKLAHLEKKRDTKPVPDPHVRPYPHDRRKLESTI